MVALVSGTNLTPYYQDEAVTLYHGDCLDVLPQIEAVDHLICDPPYSAHTHAKQWFWAKFDGSSAHEGLGFGSLTPDVQCFLVAEARRLGARWSLFFCDFESIAQWRTAIEACGLDYVRSCVWDKINSAPQFTGDRPSAGSEAVVCGHRRGKKHWNGGGGHNVLRHAVNALHGTKPHPTTKPEPLMCELVSLFTDPGDLILDPFGGSGTTAVAAKRLGRRCILIEREEKYCEVAAQRLAQGALGLFSEASA